MAEKLLTTKRRCFLMSRVKQTDTPPELAVRKILRKLGRRYRVNARDLPGSPDIANRSARWAIFVHGCYWHGHKACSLFKIPRRNREFWRDKFVTNRRRDAKANRALQDLGYHVLTVWQCELRVPGYAERKISTFFHENVTNTASVLTDGKAGTVVRQPSWWITKEGRARYCINAVLHHYGCGGSCRDHDQDLLRQRTRLRPGGAVKTVRVADLFSGCGGLSLGVQAACDHLGLDFECALAIDSHSESMEVFQKNFSPSKSFVTDICSLLPGRVGDAACTSEMSLVSSLPHIDMLLAGPPCQGHSDLNNHTRRTDSRNNLYLRVIRFVELVRPTYVLIENVPTIIHAHQEIVPHAVDALERFGYDVDTEIVNLDSLGVPQTRRRHVLFASLTGPIGIEEILERVGPIEQRSVWWAIGDLEDAKGESEFDLPSRASVENKKRMRYLIDRGLYDLPPQMRPECHKAYHTYKSMYGRLEPDKPAQTITTGFGSPGQGRYVHPTQARTITPHEAARLQLFPDYFDFSPAKTRTALATMIGNAVPMSLSYVFAGEILRRQP